MTPRKSAPDRDPVCKHLDEWQNVSRDHRNKALGQTWLDDAEQFFQLMDGSSQMPSFRPAVRVPQLQVLMMHEANDLSETSPKPFIINLEDQTRDKSREKALQAEWKRANVNYHTMFANLMSMFTGMCPLQVGYDPDMRNGKGGIWTKMRNPSTFFPDPFTDYELNWSYIILEDRMYLEEIRRRWPLTSTNLKARVSSSGTASPLAGSGGYSFQMPEGPMSKVPGLPNSQGGVDDNRLRVRWCYCLDYTREKIEAKDLPDGAMTPADFQWKYPNGRLVIDCEGLILQDGDNPYPMKMFPIAPFWSTVPLYGIWATPAIKFSKSLQDTGEKMYTQLYENAVRMNNGLTIIDERTGIDPDNFGGMPAEVQVVNPNTAEGIKILYPSAMPPQMTQLPQLLFDKQKEVQGFTPARQGQPGAGNISPELFDSSVNRAQGVTQLRGRLSAVTYQRIAELMFYTMAKYKQQPETMFAGGTTDEIVKWAPVPRPDLFDIQLDPTSIMALSQASLQKLAMQLREVGLIDARSTLEALQWPDAATVASAVENEQALQALGKVRGNKR